MMILHILSSLKDLPCGELPEAARRTLERCADYSSDNVIVYIVIIAAALVAAVFVAMKK